MLDRRSKEIDGLTFHVQKLPARRAMRLMHKLGHALGPALLKSLAGVELKPEKGAAGIKLEELDLGGVANGVQLLFDRFSADDFDALVQNLFETATVVEPGKPELPLMTVFDNIMAGRMSTLLKLLKFGIEVNYQDFFGGLLASVAALRAERPSPE